jgi:hypothetical protein
VVVTELAETSVAYFLGELVAMSVIPIAGAVLLVVGLRRRSRGPQLPPGYPPPPNPYGPPPNPYQPGPPPTPPQYYPSPRPAGSSTALILVGLLLLGGGILGITSRAIEDLASHKQITAHAATVGQCMSESDVQQKHVNAPPQDCDRPDAIFEVVSKGGASANCPDGKLKDSQYAVLGDDSTTLCLMLNFRKGRCYAASGDDTDPMFTPSSCDGAGPIFRVSERIDGSTDTEACPAGTKAVAYPQPAARLYCLSRVEN